MIMCMPRAIWFKFKFSCRSLKLSQQLQLLDGTPRVEASKVLNLSFEMSVRLLEMAVLVLGGLASECALELQLLTFEDFSPLPRARS